MNYIFGLRGELILEDWKARSREGFHGLDRKPSRLLAFPSSKKLKRSANPTHQSLVLSRVGDARKKVLKVPAPSSESSFVPR